MKVRWSTVTLSLCAALAAENGAAQSSGPPAQAYPTKPIRIVVGFAPGGLPDIAARAIAEQLSPILKQPLVVENRPGAGGTLAAQLVARAEPDGHTLLCVTAAHAAAPALYAKLPYDAARDFAGVSLLGTNPMLLIAAASLGVKSIADLIALAKAKPGELNFASAGIGSNTHFSMEVFKSKAGIDIVHVPFKGIPEALTETMAGRVQLFMTPIGPVLEQVKSGKVVALGSTGTRRSVLLPDVPTVAGSGALDYRWEAWFGFLVPAKTPRAIVTRLDRETARILERPDIRERWTKMGAEMSPSTPERFDRLIRDEIALLVRAARAANIKAE